MEVSSYFSLWNLVLLRSLATISIITAFLVSGCSADEAGYTEPPPKPNVLFIVVDDMGFNDLGINGARGSLSPTPKLDEFASQGVRFTRNYVDSTCSATRAGILSGRPPSSIGFRPNGRGLSPELLTLPETLRNAGYSTHHIGKWHLGYTSRMSWPLQQGYDSFFGFLSQFLLAGPHTEDEFILGKPRYRSPWLQHGNDTPVKYRGHLSDLLSAEVKSFLVQSSKMDQPWFLSYSTYLPHTPQQPAKRFAKRFPDSEKGRYQAMIAQLDWMLGELFELLDEEGLAASTLVVVASDNGGAFKNTESNLPYAGSKMTYQEGGVRTPLLIRWPDRLQAGRVVNDVVSYLDYFPTIANVAGAEIPVGLKGRNLFNFLDGESLQERPLFWESGSQVARSWAILSENGRWRLSRFFDSAPILNDLQSDTSGSLNVFDTETDVAQQLLEQFVSWRAESSMVKVDIERSPEGGLSLTGDSFQRSPGFGAFTFGVGVRLESTSLESQVIAKQSDVWELSIAGEAYTLKMGDSSLDFSARTSDRCQSLVVASHYDWNFFLPRKSKAIIEVFLDGEMVTHAKIDQPTMMPDRYLEKTMMGQDEYGGRVFHGELSEPFVLNERLVSDEAGDPWLENKVGAYTSMLCPF